MKIGIDARLFGTRHAGLGRYTQKLIDNLEEVDQQNQYVVFLQKDNFDEYQPKNPNFKKVLADFRVYSWQEQILFPRVLRKHKLDLVHFTHFNVPLFFRGKFIVTIHDLIISHHPDSRATTLNPILYKLKLLVYNFLIRQTAKRAQKIIAISGFTKDDIVKLLKVKENKISVIYEGFDLPQDQEGDCGKVLSEFGIQKDFLLYVGSAYPHKNLEKLISSFSDILKYHDVQLVLVGKDGYFYKRIREEIKKLNLDGRIITTGYLEDKKLICLYKQAKLYIFPSLIEGFGLPPLEAQSYNLPVVSSNSSCLPEILGDSALYFNPEDTDDMSRKINQVLKDDILREDLIARGLENIKKYSWHNCAIRTLDLYT